jgi:hypothetical protein
MVSLKTNMNVSKIIPSNFKNSLSIKQILAIKAHLAEKMVNPKVGKHFYTYLNHLVGKQSLHSCPLLLNIFICFNLE